MLGTVGMGWVGQNKLKVVINSPTLGQILSSNLLETVGVGWVGQNRFRFVVNGPTLGRVLGNGELRTVSEGCSSGDWFDVGVVSPGMNWILGSTVLRAVGVGWFDVKKIVDILRERVETITGLRAVKWGSNRVCLVPGARSEVIVLWEIGVEGVAGG